MRAARLAIVVLATWLPACGAWLEGSATEVPIRTRPTGADVYIDGEYAGRTPLRASFQSSRSYEVELRSAGRATRRFRVSPEVDAAIVVFDILLTGGIGLVVDLALDSLHASSPDRIEVVLRPQPPAADANAR